MPDSSCSGARRRRARTASRNAGSRPADRAAVEIEHRAPQHAIHQLDARDRVLDHHRDELANERRADAAHDCGLPGHRDWRARHADLEPDHLLARPQIPRVGRRPERAGIGIAVVGQLERPRPPGDRDLEINVAEAVVDHDLGWHAVLGPAHVDALVGRAIDDGRAEDFDAKAPRGSRTWPSSPRGPRSILVARRGDGRGSRRRALRRDRDVGRGDQHVGDPAHRIGLRLRRRGSRSHRVVARLEVQDVRAGHQLEHARLELGRQAPKRGGSFSGWCPRGRPAARGTASSRRATTPARRSSRGPGARRRTRDRYS